MNTTLYPYSPEAIPAVADRDHTRLGFEQWSEAGATWIHIGPGDFGMEPVETFRARIRTGPPGL